MPGFLKWQSLRFDATACDPVIWQKSYDQITQKLSIFDAILTDNETRTKNSAALLFAVETYFALIAQAFFDQITQTPPSIIELYNWPEKSKFAQSIAAQTEQIFAQKNLHPTQCGVDLFGALYAKLLPAVVRKQLGEFYTPAWLAEHLLDVAGFDAAMNESKSVRLLDPACGSGTFLLAAVRRMLHANHSPEQIASCITGFDLNPIAVLMCAANVAFALTSHHTNNRRLFPDTLPPLQIVCHDSIRNVSPISESTTKTFGEFDFVVGNPPWVMWDKLPQDYREQTKPLWQRYGLFNLSGKESRYGGAKKELAILMVATASEHFLKTGGKLAMVLPQTILQTHKTGNGFRQFGGDDLPYQLKVLRADDFSAIRVFKDAATKTATLVFEKGRPTTYPVPYFCWQSPTQYECCEAVPVASELPGSAWRVVTNDIASNMAKPAQSSDYTAQLGANTGGANGVYWVEIISQNAKGFVTVRNLAHCSKQMLPVVEAEIEAELLFPLLRWRDVDRFSAVPSTWAIIVQDPATRMGLPFEVMQTQYPKTLAFLSEFETQLRNRAAFKKFLHDAPFYSMYNISRETFAPIKVVWRRMDTRIRAAVVSPTKTPFAQSRPVIAQETCSMIAASDLDEAHYLAALLNSEAVHQYVAAFSVVGGKGFGSPGMLSHLPIRKFDANNKSHQQLAQLGQKVSTCPANERDDVLDEINVVAKRCCLAFVEK